jgi:hypothetical protein
MFRGLKDKALSKSLEFAINQKIKDYGKMLKLNLNSKDKTIEFEIMLKGEKESLIVYIDNYMISEENGKFHLYAEDVRTSREWINIVAENYLKNQKIEVPDKIAKTLQTLI